MKNINANLSVILLDDDLSSLLYLEQLIKTSQIANVVGIFNNPLKFVQEFPNLHFDLLMLDIEMPGMSGKEVIKKVGKERCIVNTGSHLKFEEAIKCHPIDILIKPANEIHFTRALEKAQKILMHPVLNKEYHAFRTSASNDKLNIRTKDIVYVATDYDSRNKVALMQDGREYILMNYKMDELINIAPHLLQPNHSVLVSMDIIASKGYDHICLTLLNKDKKQKMVSIGRAFMKKFNLQYNKL
jgi:DNA-binding LytR/AlgR family response regulator